MYFLTYFVPTGSDKLCADVCPSPTGKRQEPAVC